MRSARRVVLVSMALVTAGALAACGGGGQASDGDGVGSSPVATATLTQQAAPTDPAAERTVSFFDIKPGDCLNMSDVETGIEATLVDCGNAHDAEVFAETTMTDAEFPGDEAAQAQAETYCVQAFGSYVGVEHQNSKYEIYYFTPTQETWAGRDDRLISCIIYDTAPYTGTLEGANQ